MPKYTILRSTPPNRVGTHDGDGEEHFPEGSIMVAFALHLLRMGAQHVELHPDGMHAKHHDIEAQLNTSGFRRLRPGNGSCAGDYQRSGRTLSIDFRSGVGDVVGTVNGTRVVAECKGGIVNSRHAGATSRLRKGLCEAVGQLIGREQPAGERHIAVVPYTRLTATVAERMARRAIEAGIELALVKSDGQVVYAQTATG